jgi:hypothetical protein
VRVKEKTRVQWRGRPKRANANVLATATALATATTGLLQQSSRLQNLWEFREIEMHRRERGGCVSGPGIDVNPCQNERDGTRTRNHRIDSPIETVFFA